MVHNSNRNIDIPSHRFWFKMWSIALERFISLYLSIYLFMYVCCVCMPVYGLPAHVEAETDGRCLPSLLFSTCFETWSLTEPTACHLAVQAGQLAPGILLLLHPPPYWRHRYLPQHLAFIGCWESETGSSCLCSKHFTYWAISPSSSLFNSQLFYVYMSFA